MRKETVFLLLLSLVMSGCRTTGMFTMQLIKYSTARTYNAPYEEVWDASKKAMEGYELVVLDSDDKQQSGLLISDWVKGKSDAHWYRDKNGVEHPCRNESSLHATVEGEGGNKTRVDVKIYERTEIMTPAGPIWQKTESSTLREKRILDTIGLLLEERH